MIAKKMKIGDDFQGGKLLWVFSPGEPGYIANEFHGIVIASYDQSTRILAAPEDGSKWATGSHRAFDIGMGEINTNLIATSYGITSTYAGVLCYNLVLNGYDDWYLPSYNELDLMLLEKANLGSLPAQIYWSSTEDDTPTPGSGVYLDRGGYCINMSTGATTLELRDNRCAGVRAFRNF